MDKIQIKLREDFPKLLNELKLTGWGAEIGVWRGYFSEHMLRESNLSLFFSIDLWSSKYIKDKWTQDKIDDAYRETIEKLLPFRERSICIKATSEVAAQLIPNNSLDFVFIDATHTYEAVKNDLHFWWKKIKTKGVFAGHDFFARHNATKETWGVIEAVTEFASQKSLRIYSTSERMPSWYCIKPNYKIL